MTPLLRKLHRRDGMSLWSVLALVGLAVSIAGVGYFALRPTERNDAHGVTVKRMQALGDALEKYAIDNGGIFPSSKQGLQALLVKPPEKPMPRNWRGPYLQDTSVLRDAWGTDFHYVAPGGGEPPRAYDVWSLGADHQEGGTGPAADVRSEDRSTFLPPSP